MATQRSFTQLSAELTQALSLTQAPVAISFSDTSPSGLSHPTTRVAAGCRY